MLAASIADPSDQDAYDAEVQAIIHDAEQFLRDGLKFNFTVQHGPVVLRNGIGVALASVHGELDSESGVLAEFRQQANLPYLLAADVRVGLGGQIGFETSIPPVSASAADTQFEFSGFNASGTYDTGSNTLKAVARSDSFEVINEELRVLVNGIDVQGEGKQYTERMWLGDATIAIAELQLEAPLEEIAKVAMQKLQFDAGSELNGAGDKLSVSANYQIGGVTGLPDTSLADMQMRVRMRDLDVAAVTEYLGIYEQLAIATPDTLANDESSAMIEGLIEQGMLRRANGKLIAELEFKQGQLLVNGVPIPL